MNVPIVDERAFPPGTVRLSDRAESHLVLSPQPTSDPNDPLVRPRRGQVPTQLIIRLELVHVSQVSSHISALVVRHNRRGSPHKRRSGMGSDESRSGILLCGPQ